ncbi:MAG: sugar phosphate isomerase/epimerase [Gemmatimonadota bacterium]
MDRRAFLHLFGVRVGAGALGLGVLGAGAFAGALERRAVGRAPISGTRPQATRGGWAAPHFPARIGIQLYSVRREMEQDLPGTLARVAEIGFREVELAGYFGRTPQEIRALLAEQGLEAPSTHVPFEALTDDWAGVLGSAATAGHRWVTIPSIPGSARSSADAWRRIVDLFHTGAEAARAAGLRFAYHNHAFEFEPVEGIVPFDLLLEATDPELVDIEMDVYWVVRGGGDPLRYMASHPGRFPLLHLKDSAGPPGHTMVDLGEGMVDLEAILRLARETGVRHVFAEHDAPADPMGFARTAFEYLDRER